jgi:hypothetical protein
VIIAAAQIALSSVVPRVVRGIPGAQPQAFVVASADFKLSSSPPVLELKRLHHWRRPHYLRGGFDDGQQTSSQGQQTTTSVGGPTISWSLPPAPPTAYYIVARRLYEVVRHETAATSVDRSFARAD